MNMLNNCFLITAYAHAVYHDVGFFIGLGIDIAFIYAFVKLCIIAPIQTRRKNKPLREKLSRLHDEVLQVMDEKGIPRTDFSPEVDRIYSLSLDKAVREMEKALERVQRL